MHGLLRELVAHQAWADAELWKGLAATPGALDDAEIVPLLRHLHQAQRAFLDIVRRTRGDWESYDSCPVFPDLKSRAVQTCADATAFLASASDQDLSTTLTISFKKPPNRVTASDALAQAALHSMHHRGQLLMRLRRLGGSPPTLDFIHWHWLGRPPAAW